MKKILNLVSVLTISGTAIPTTIAASPYQKEQEKEYYQDTINYEFFLNEPNKIFFTFSKKRWNEIKKIYQDIYKENKINTKYQKQIFNINFIDILNNGVWQDWRLKSNSYNAISENIFDNFDLINNIIEKTKQDYYQLNTDDKKSYFSFFPSTKGVPYSFTKEISKPLNKAIILLSSGAAGAAIGIIGNIIIKYSIIIGTYKALNINFVTLVGWVISGATPLIAAGAAIGIIIGVVIVGLQIYYFVQ